MRRSAALLVTAFCALAAPTASAQDLAAAIADALAQSPSLDEAQAGEAAASARLDQARAQRNPLLRLEGSAGVGRIDNGGFFGISADDVTPLALQAAAEMPLFAGGRVGSAIQQAGAGRDMARLQAEQARLQTVVRAVGTYAEVLTARRLEDRFRQLADALTETERQARLRFEAGEIASSDLAQARARRAEGAARLAQAEGRRHSAEAAFARLTGKPATDLAPLPAPPTVPASLDQALDLARAGNPALLQAEAATRAADAGARAARAEALPTVGAYAEAAHVRDQFFPDYRADSVAVGIRGRWTLFSGGRTSAATRAASADADASDARLRQARLDTDGAMIDSWQGLQSAAKVVEASRLRSAATAEALRSRRLEAKVGAVPLLAVLDAEREAVEAEAALIEAEGMRLVMAWRVNALTGVLDQP